MTGYQSKKKSTQVKWLGPYAPNDRHADDVTIDHLIALHRENMLLQDALQQAVSNVNDLTLRSMTMKKAIQDIMDYCYTQDRDSLNQIETILRLRGAIDAMRQTP